MGQSLQEHFSIVAIDAGIIVGFGDIDKTGYLDRLFVHSGYQRKGIATAICNRLDSTVRENIVHTLLLQQSPFLEKEDISLLKSNK